MRTTDVGKHQPQNAPIAHSLAARAGAENVLAVAHLCHGVVVCSPYTGVSLVIVPVRSMLVQCRSEYDTSIFGPIPELAHFALRRAVRKPSTRVSKFLAIQW